MWKTVICFGSLLIVSGISAVFGYAFGLVAEENAKSKLSEEAILEAVARGVAKANAAEHAEHA